MWKEGRDRYWFMMKSAEAGDRTMLLRSFLSYFQHYRGPVALLLFVSMAGGLAELVFPMGVRHVLQLDPAAAPWRQILQWVLLLGCCYLLNFALLFLGSYYSGKLSAGMENDMREALFRHLEHLPFSFYDRTRTGQLLATLMGDLAEAGNLAARIPGDLIVGAFSAAGTICLLLYLNRTLGSAVVVLMAVKVLHTVAINTRLRRRYDANRHEFGHLSALGEEAVNGVRMVKAYTAEERCAETFRTAARRYLKARVSAFRLDAYFGASINLFTNSINLCILLLGAWEIRAGAMTYADLTAFFLYVGIFIKPAMKLVIFVETYQRSMAGFRRFYALMQEPVESGEELPDMPVPCGRIEFRDVSFGYDGKRPVLSHISLVIEPGQKVGFVGPTGTGKSTLAHLLLRFYDPTEGTILVDGVDISRYNRASVRRQIALVQQDVFLFSDSVRRNIAFGDFDGSGEAIRRAAESADAWTFIRHLPQQIDTPVGERGVKLSGGQRQRISLARAFLKDAPILVLDEATSALDNLTEDQVQKEMDRLGKGRTALVIAHRLGTVLNADRIVVLEGGKIRETGSPQALLAQSGIFRRLWEKENRKRAKKEGVESCSL